MNAACAKFILKSVEDEVIADVCNFLTELGPEKIIGVHLNCTGDAVIVWYWMGASQLKQVVNDFSKVRCYVNTPQPVMIIPTAPPPGTLMCQK